MKFNSVVTESLRLPVMWMSHLCSCLLGMLTSEKWRNLILSSLRDSLTVIWITIGIYVSRRSSFGTYMHLPMDLSREKDELEIRPIVVHSETLKIFMRKCKFTFQRKFIDMVNLISSCGIKCFEVARDSVYTVLAVHFTICDLSFCYHSDDNIGNFGRRQDEI